MEERSQGEQKLWLQEIPFVLDLLKANPEGIVDDTSVEKLLNWLQDVAQNENEEALLDKNIGIIDFLSSGEVLNHPVCLSFALRLSGIVGSVNTTCFKELNEKGVLCLLFTDSVKTLAWSNPSVRCGFFKGLVFLMKHEEGKIWIRESDFTNLALEAFSDSSYYVTNAAIDFLAHFISMSGSGNIDSVLLQHIENSATHMRSSGSMAIVLNHLKLLTTLFSKDVNAALILLDKVGPLITIFESLKRVTRDGTNVVQEAISFLDAAIEKSRFVEFSWENIFAKQDGVVEERLRPAEGMISLSLTLMKQEYLKPSVRFLASLAIDGRQPTSGFPSFWNELLMHILMSFALERFDATGMKLDDFRSIEYPNPAGLLEKASVLISSANQLINEPSVWIDVFMTILNFANGVFNKMIPHKCTQTMINTTEKFITFVLKMVDMSTCKVNQERFTLPIEYSQHILDKNKVAISCLSFFREFLSGQWFWVLPQMLQLQFIDVMSDISKISDISATISCQAIHLSSIFIQNMSISLADIIFKSTNVASEAKVECEEKKIQVLSDVINSDCSRTERLAGIWDALMLDERWEIQDSLLELILVMIEKAKDIPTLEEFLAIHRCFWLKSWTLLESQESYIRASSVKVIGKVVEHEKLLAVFEKYNQLTLDDVIDKFLVILKADDEAFARRSVMDVLLEWVQLSVVTRPRLFVAKTRLHHLKGAAPSLESRKLSDSISEPRRLSDCISEPNAVDKVVKALNIASEDFDWEVKLKGIQLWEQLLHSIIGSSCDRSFFPRLITVIDPKERLNILTDFICSSNGSNILMSGLNDCDYPVRVAAFKTLEHIQKLVHKEPVTPSKDTNNPVIFLKEQISIKSLAAIEEHLIKMNVTKVDGFLSLLLSLDFISIKETLKPMDTLVKSDPTSFLQDILVAAKQHEENLLDCY